MFLNVQTFLSFLFKLISNAFDLLLVLSLLIPSQDFLWSEI